MDSSTSRDDFGCDQCWPPDAEAAWAAHGVFRGGPVLIDESHFRVTISACAHCPQRFIRVFTEQIDWADGEDPQSWAVMPVTEPEAAELIRYGDALPVGALEALGPGRRSLRRDYPKGAEPSVSWERGLSVGYHD